MRLRQAVAMSVILVDSASLYWRAFFALPRTITTPDGQPVNALRGFIDVLASLLERYPDHRVIACWDEDWRPQWRVDRVPTYKTHRLAEQLEKQPDGGVEVVEEAPDELSPQIPMIKDMLAVVGIPVAGAPGCEADDVIATYCRGPLRAASDVTVVSGDRDLIQLIDDHTKLLYTGGSTKSRGGQPWLELTPDAVLGKYGIAASLYADMASLRGDPSDGLPGVPGIGEKTAIALIQSFGGLTQVLAAAALPAVKPMTVRIASLLLEHEATLQATFDVVALAPRPEVPPPPPAGTLDRSRATAWAQEFGVGRSMSRLVTQLAGE
jgi:5'-3' exonuclease